MKLLPRDCPITYAQQYRRCGDIHCKCYKGQRHGPYWYTFYYDRQMHRCTSVYIGKEKVEGVTYVYYSSSDHW